MISEVNNGYLENLPEEVVLNEVKLEDIEVAPVKAKNGKKAKLTSQLKTTKEVKALSTSLEDYLEKVFLLAKKYEEVRVMDMQKINWWKKGTTFLRAKITGKKYEKSF